jgi:glycosyltransferase involved in cell wall biosynthesis
VCLVAPSLDILGGQAVQAARLVQGLRQVDSNAVGFLPVNPRLPGPLRLLQRVRYLRTVVTSLRYVWTLLRRLPEYDIVHVFSASYLSFLLAPTPAILVGKWLGKKVILNYRSGEAEDHLRRWARSAIPVMRLADALVVPSGYLVDVFARVGMQGRVVANIVDFDQFRFRERRPLRPVFLSNRNFESHYNVACVLRAFALIQRTYPDARLIIAGDGAERASLMHLARELCLNKAEFIGRVMPDRMPALYQAADVYLNAPDIDNMPASILEAFASGLPVVTTDAGGIPYIVRHEETGWMVPRGDHAGMAAGALRLLADSSLAERLITNALEECRRKYTPQAVVGEWRRVYAELLAYAQTPAPELSARPGAVS